MRKPVPSRSSTWMAQAALVFILVMGSALRLYHLGVASLWLDEAGVAYAARMATISEMLQVVRSHVMAMPLDYLVVWLVGRISLQEAVLRLPAALWGIGSLYLAFLLFRRAHSTPAALLGLLFLALSPLHIQYSQELRFYSSLVFFYLLSTLLLWRALEQPTRGHWAVFIAMHILGIYFHPYVLLAGVNGFTWLVLSLKERSSGRPQRIGFMLSMTLSLLAFFAGYRTFSGGNFFAIPLMVFEDSWLTALATSLGWLPFYPGSPGIHWIWGGLCAALEITGVIATVRRQPGSPLAGLSYSLLLQIGLVFVMDLAGHYFFAPRQLIMLLPVLCLFAGAGALQVIHTLAFALARLLRRMDGAAVKRTAATLTVLIILLASLPAIRAYQADDKGNSRAISAVLAAAWQPGDSILIAPGYDGFVYKYYVEDVAGRPDITARMFGVDFAQLAQTSGWNGSIFAITPLHLAAQETSQMRAWGFQERYRSFSGSRYAKILWVREANP